MYMLLFFYCKYAAAKDIKIGKQKTRFTVCKAISLELVIYFSFYQMSMIISVVLGTFMSGVVDQLTGSLRNSIIVFAVIFILGAILLRDIKMKSI